MHVVGELNGRSDEVFRSLSKFHFAIMTGKATKCLIHVLMWMAASQEADAHRTHIGAGYLKSSPSECEIILDLPRGIIWLYIDVILGQVDVVLRGQQMQCMTQCFHRCIAILHGVGVRNRPEQEIAMDQSQGNMQLWPLKPMKVFGIHPRRSWQCHFSLVHPVLDDANNFATSTTLPGVRSQSVIFKSV